jgi:HAD superfamily hydrolase (TIGR01509 family)
MSVPAAIDLLGVMFDLDGTLTQPMIDFKKLKQQCGMSPGGDILKELEAMPTRERHKAKARIEAVETEAALQALGSRGAVDLVRFLQDQGIYTAILTRNSRASLNITLQRLELEVDFSLAREDALPKPDPDGIHQFSQHFNIPPEHLLMVGDFVYDIEAGKAAGAYTALVTGGRQPAFECYPDFQVDYLEELHQWIVQWLETKNVGG